MLSPEPGATHERPIFLVGMPGAGKSTVGKRLAHRLGRSFVDADRELERRCGVPVATIFELEGEDGFRRRESQLLAELAQMRDAVIATGGGAVLREENRATMREGARVVYLDAPIGELWHRLRNDRNRPLLQTSSPRATLEALLAARVPLYEAVADIRVLSSRQSADRLAIDIIERLRSAR